ncbi:alpha/beta fold hydrolase [Porphyrobacter sp. ULC335]|jgi:pimeloyl-ACP methyl ester carboxylesterase|uniref:alpha/beta fold hydrolase n=1 Tax=Porphyrobacter sp. ULC335 TaxID=2854260 RepID=UPI0022206D34|nr:alpha/beta hydrolase [Porphyrobacter sp. ULC335]UYV15569.1 alpha/beta hydrolase [Porphyrobacter sp. ULC335]
MVGSDCAVLYFHGLPGSQAELCSFGPAIAANARHFHVVARTDALVDGDSSGYFSRLAEQIERQFAGVALHLAGFSLGAATALRVALFLGERVARIDLVSPAAPLQLGDFLGGMAGAPVFRAALAGRWPFAALTLVQAQVARLAAQKMAGALMAKAKGEDRALAADPRFIAALAQSLRHSLLEQRDSYQAEIRAYVGDWRADLALMHQPVRIWQGSADDWTPPAMAEALAAALPTRPQVTMLPGCSHFSALRHYLSERAA